eukprot:m.76741 g.76741  ORF g.76741 m.76741 type:complete len:271 (+) comp50458_c0_seq4:1726-2538(+)
MTKPACQSFSLPSQMLSLQEVSTQWMDAKTHQPSKAQGSSNWNQKSFDRSQRNLSETLRSQHFHWEASGPFERARSAPKSIETSEEKRLSSSATKGSWTARMELVSQQPDVGVVCLPRCQSRSLRRQYHLPENLRQKALLAEILEVPAKYYGSPLEVAQPAFVAQQHFEALPKKQILEFAARKLGSEALSHESLRNGNQNESNERQYNKRTLIVILQFVRKAVRGCERVFEVRDLQLGGAAEGVVKSRVLRFEGADALLQQRDFELLQNH